MPAKKKITKEMILENSLQLLREQGYEAINVRTIAKRLGCSTQPVYYVFTNLDELKEELKSTAANYHRKIVKECLDGEEYDAYRAYGIGFVRFAVEERELFRYLYLYGRKGGKDVDDIHLPQIIQLMQNIYGYTEEVARNFHHDMSFYSYGIAMMMNTGYIELTEEEVSERLHTEFMALTSVYGPPPNFMRDRQKGYDRN